MEGTYYVCSSDDAPEIIYFSEDDAFSSGYEFIDIFDEDGEKLMSRFYQAFLNISKDTLEKHPERAYEEFIKRGGDRIKLHDEAIITIEDIEEMCKMHNPKIVVIDHADILQFHGDSKLGDVARLKRVYYKLRELTK